MSEDKDKILKLTTDQIESKFGKGSIMKLGDGGAERAAGAARSALAQGFVTCVDADRIEKELAL